MYHISFYAYADKGSMRAQIFHLRIGPAAGMTISKARPALYIKKLYIDMGHPLFLLLQKCSTKQAAIIDRT